MTKEEKEKKIEEICNEAMRKFDELGKERTKIIRNYVKELEAKKIDVIRASINI